MIGIAEFAKESASRNLGAPRVHLSFTLDGSGIVTLSKAEVRHVSDRPVGHSLWYLLFWLSATWLIGWVVGHFSIFMLLTSLMTMNIRN